MRFEIRVFLSKFKMKEFIISRLMLKEMLLDDRLVMQENVKSIEIS